MGQAKQKWMEDEKTKDLIEFLEILLKRETFNGALEGIAKQAISKGIKSLSDKQINVIDIFIVNYKNRNECERCGNGNISKLTEYISVEDEGFCPICSGDREKFMRD